MQGIHLRKYGVETTIDFELYEVDGVNFRTDAVDAGSDCTIMKDEGAEATCTNDFVDEGKGYSITATATEMQAARIVVYIVDSATKVWLDKAIVIETYGHASAMHAMDLDDATRGGLTALPNANADAAGGLPISDAGELDLDTKLANTNEVTAARMGALTDWINGGRLDLLLDAILADTNELQVDDYPTSIAAVKAETALIVEDTNEVQGKLPTNKFMGSSDGADDDATLNTIATDAARLTAARAAVLTDLINGGRLDLLIDAIKAKTDNLPADPADDSDIDAQLATIAGYLDTEIASILEEVDTEVAAIKVVTDNLADSATTLISGTVSWDNTNATTTVFYSDDITEATADHYNGRIVIFTSGALLGQATDITDYALDTGEGKFTVTALTEPPPDNCTFVIV